MSATNLKPLQDAIKLLADVAIDSVKAAGDSSPVAKAVEFENLLSDLLVLIPEIGEIPASAEHLLPEDFVTLTQNLAEDLVLPNGKAMNLITASITLLKNIELYIVPNIQAIIAAAKS